MYYKMRASVSDILGCTDFATMASSSSSTTSSSSPPPVTVNGIHNDYDDVASSRTNNFVSTSPTSKPIILHLGAPVHYNEEIYERLSSQYHVIRPPPEDLQRPVFMKHLRDRTWGNFSAIIKPFWSSGSDMHPWDEELIKLLPESMKIMAGAGAGYDWVKTRALSERGILPIPTGFHLCKGMLLKTRRNHLRQWRWGIHRVCRQYSPPPSHLGLLTRHTFFSSSALLVKQTIQ